MTSTRTHVPTWAADDRCFAGIGAGSALVRSWVTFAQNDCGPGADRKAHSDCVGAGHRYCLVMQYLDPDWTFTQGVVSLSALTPVAKASWFLHVPGQRNAPIYSQYEGGGYLVNQNQPAVRSFFQSYVERHFNRDDGLMLDEQSAGLAQELYYSSCHCTRTQEIASDRQLQNAHRLLSAGLTHADGAAFFQVDNSLPPNGFLPQGFGLLDRQHGVDGLVTEGEPMQWGVFDPNYSTLLDQIAYVEDRTHGFIVTLSHGYAGAKNMLQSRLVQEGTVLLGFKPHRIIDWAQLEQGSPDLEIWPEEGIYPTAPLEGMRAPRGHGCLGGGGGACTAGGHNDLEVAAGVYRREFRTCYDRGQIFGACAAIVNTTGHAVVVKAKWLPIVLRHQIVLVGGDVQSSGQVAVTGAPFRAGATQVPAQNAILLAP